MHSHAHAAVLPKQSRKLNRENTRRGFLPSISSFYRQGKSLKVNSPIRDEKAGIRRRISKSFSLLNEKGLLQENSQTELFSLNLQNPRFKEKLLSTFLPFNFSDSDSGEQPQGFSPFNIILLSSRRNLEKQFSCSKRKSHH